MKPKQFNPYPKEHLFDIDFLMPDEQWVPVFEYEGKYAISNYGRLMSINRLGKKLVGNTSTDSGGYYSAHFYDRPHRPERYSRIHVIVGETFLVKPLFLDHPSVNHDDGNKLNNYYKNLEWMEKSDNVKHAFETGIVDFNGENSVHSKLTAKEVIWIREQHKTGLYTHEKLAEMLDYKVNRRHLTDILNRVNWKHV